MSFDRFQRRSVTQRLATSGPRGGSHENILRRLTLGGAEFYNDRVQPWCNRQPQEFPESSAGFLDLMSRRSATVCHRRYRVERFLAVGTFAQIYVAADKYNQCAVALKVMKKGVEMLAFREKVFLDHLQVGCRRGPSYFGQVQNIFEVSGHWCIAMPLYEGTLMDFVTDRVTVAAALRAAEEASSALSSPSHPRIRSGALMPIVDEHVLRPKAMRSTAGSALVQTSDPTSNLNGTKEVNRSEVRIIRRVLVQLLSALWVLDKEGVIHGDIKPENCFLSFQGRTKDVPISSNGHTSSIEAKSPLKDHIMSPSRGSGWTPFASGLYSAESQKGIGKPLGKLTEEFTIKLGDFGNALHVSERPMFYEAFELQSLPYRSPELLLGLRNFTPAVDVWAVGIIAIELLLGYTLFQGKDREEVLLEIESTFGRLSRTRFSSGKFAHLLLRSGRSVGGSQMQSPTGLMHDSSQWNRAEQSKCLRRFLAKHVSLTGVPTEDVNGLLDLLTHITAVDPSHRLTPIDALQHSFLAECLLLPLPLLVHYAEQSADQNQQQLLGSKRRRISTSASHNAALFSSW